MPPDLREARVCSRCGRRRPPSDFAANGGGRLRADCRPCRNAAQRARRRRRAEPPTSPRPAPAPRGYSLGGRAIAWIKAHCVHSRGPLRGRPLRLLAWQRDLLWRLLELRELRERGGAPPEAWPLRYCRALIGAPPGNGKTALLAALGLWLLLDDAAAAGPRVACAAASERADFAFQAARTMCRLSPDLRAVTEVRERALLVPLRPGAQLVRLSAGGAALDAADHDAVLIDDLQSWITPGQAAGHRLLCTRALAPAVADAPDGTASLVVIYREVGYTADRRVAAEGGVAAVMIVEMQPAGKRGGAGRLAAVDADVGPLLEEGAVEAFDLAVGLRPVGAGAAMADAGGQAGASEVGAAVARTVVGEHGRTLTPRSANQLRARCQNATAVTARIVGQNLAVGDTRSSCG